MFISIFVQIIRFNVFGLRTTNYLRDNSDVQMSISENTEKRGGFVYVNGPRHVSDVLNSM